jgi:hypothetical protein
LRFFGVFLGSFFFCLLRNNEENSFATKREKGREGRHEEEERGG